MEDWPESIQLTPYDIEQQKLRNVAALILPIEPKLRRLPKKHVEQLVIWLKRIHNPVDPDDRSVENTAPFFNRVEELRNLPEQVEYQNRCIKIFRVAMFCCMSIGSLATVAVWGLVEGFYASLVLLIALPILWRRALRNIHQTVVIAKEQEQKHLFGSIREATNVSQLQTAGPFAHIDNKDYDKHVQQMRDAIYRRGEEGYMFGEHMRELTAGIDSTGPGTA